MFKNKKLTLNKLIFVQIVTFIILPFTFFTRILYTKLLTVEQLGLFYSLFAFIGLISLFVNFGFSSSVRYFFPKFIVNKDFNKLRNIFFYSTIIQLTLLSLISILLYFFTVFFMENYFNSVESLIIFYLFIFIFYFNNLLTMILDIFVSFNEFILYKVGYFLQIFLIFIFLFFLFFYNLEINLFIIVLINLIVIFLIFLIFIIYLIKNYTFLFKLPKFDKLLFREFITYSFYVFINGLGMTIFLQIDILVITYFLSTTYVAYYSNSIALVETLVYIFSSISIILMPYIVELYEKNDFINLNKILNTLYGLILYLISPIIMIFFLFSKQILILIYGVDYIPGTNILMILSLFSIFNILLVYNLTFMNAFGLAKKLVYVILPISIMNLILNIILINSLGLIGVAISTILSWILLLIITMKLIYDKIKFKLNYNKILKIFILILIFIFLVFILKKFSFFENYYLNSLLILSISFLFYFILGYIFKIYSIKELLIFIPNGKIKSKIKKIHKKYFNFLN